MWNKMETAPKDKPILAWCVHSPSAVYDNENECLTTYGAHNEGLCHVKDGLNIICWGGGYCEDDWESSIHFTIPDWWFLNDGCYETVANPVLWCEIPDEPTIEELNNE